jgi:hypothetical protein
VAITRSKPKLPPFTRLVHVFIALAFIVVLVAAGQRLGLHTVAGMVLGVLLLIWLVLMSFGLTTKRGAPLGGFNRTLNVVLLIVLLLTVGLGLIGYGANFAAGPLAPWLAGNAEWGRLAAQYHPLLALLALILVVAHGISIGIAKWRARRNARLR